MPEARPRLRRLELFPVEVDGAPMICVRDPTGLTDKIGFLPRPAALAAVLCDGSRTVAEVAAEVGRRAGASVSSEQVAALLADLDDSLFLEGPRLEAHRRDVVRAFHLAPTRPPSHAGGAYPGEPGPLAARLDALLAEAASEPAPQPLAPAAGAPALLVSPHIDHHRGGATYARAFRALDPAAPPDLVVVLGTDHNGVGWPFTLTRKHYDTPLGALRTDVAVVDELTARLPFHATGLFADELHHKNEHSIELVAVWLRHLYGGAAPPLLPVLCGSLHAAIEQHQAPAADPRVAGFLDALTTATARRSVLVVAAADLSHVGPRFGDGPMGAPERQRVEADDRRALAAAADRDAEGFFAAIAAVGDRNRVCGLAPVYHGLALAGPGGRPGTLLDYAQADADDAGTSFVSIAALAV
jgi:AmmeMemoRadiSam system protein B